MASSHWSTSFDSCCWWLLIPSFKACLLKQYFHPLSSKENFCILNLQLDPCILKTVMGGNGEVLTPLLIRNVTWTDRLFFWQHLKYFQNSLTQGHFGTKSILCFVYSKHTCLVANFLWILVTNLHSGLLANFPLDCTTNAPFIWINSSTCHFVKTIAAFTLGLTVTFHFSTLDHNPFLAKASALASGLQWWTAQTSWSSKGSLIANGLVVSGQAFANCFSVGFPLGSQGDCRLLGYLGHQFNQIFCF